MILIVIIKILVLLSSQHGHLQYETSYRMSNQIYFYHPGILLLNGEGKLFSFSSSCKYNLKKTTQMFYDQSFASFFLQI